MWREILNICHLLYNPVTRLGKWEVIATFESTTDGCMALVLGFEPSGYGVGFDRRSQSKRIHITLAMLASLIDEEFSIVDDDTDKTLVTQDVATLRVRVSQSTIGEFAQATVLAFFVDFAGIVTIGHAVKYSLRRIAEIRLEFGAETDGVWYDARVFTRNWTSPPRRR